MIRRIVYAIITLLIASVGVLLDNILMGIISIEQLSASLGFPIKLFWTYVFSFIVFGIIGFLLAPAIMKFFIGLFKWLESKLTRIPVYDLIGGSIGIIIGLIIARLLSGSFKDIPFIGPVLSVAVSIFLAYIGLVVGVKRKEDFLAFFSFFPKFKAEKGEKQKELKTPTKQNITGYKVLDTSVIIDGRIADIAKTGFLDGVLLIPRFVLEELRHIADSSDVLKRNRGRRGLDILNQISKESSVKVEIYEGDFEDITEVDSKLLRLASTMNIPILTNDYNLNKVAELHGIKVLNINELANAVKPVVLPGEEMNVLVMKEGKESGQGVAYLDDGTMVVIDSGRRYIGQQITVLVTTVLQTAAGRMIFAKPKGMLEKSSEEYPHEFNAFG
ncbi:MAG: PIN/TRAM domain-containing protein [Peptococcaceae bacterium]|nr:PIN/TRAM domain-containing protein [Peptococcaceae bacterium]